MCLRYVPGWSSGSCSGLALFLWRGRGGPARLEGRPVAGTRPPGWRRTLPSAGRRPPPDSPRAGGRSGHRTRPEDSAEQDRAAGKLPPGKRRPAMMPGRAAAAGLSPVRIQKITGRARPLACGPSFIRPGRTSGPLCPSGSCGPSEQRAPVLCAQSPVHISSLEGGLAQGLLWVCGFPAFSRIATRSAVQSALNLPAPWRWSCSARMSTSMPAPAIAAMVCSAAA